MGLKQSRQRDLLDGSEWLRTVVQHHQKKRNGVAGFDFFVMEPAEVVERDPADCLDGERSSSRDGGSNPKNGSKSCRDDEVRYTFQDGGVRLTRVHIRFRNNKEQIQEVHWLVKSSSDHKEGRRAIQSLQHEAKVFSTLLPDTQKFLASKRNPRSKYLLNIPDLVFQERRSDGGHVTRCHLVLEDVTQTKHCVPIDLAQLSGGLTVGQFRVFLGTLAQFHAVGIAWNASVAKEETIMDSFPFLNRADPDLSSMAERERLLIMYDKLLRWRLRLQPKNKHCQRRMKLFNMMHSTSNDIWRTSLQWDLCDPLGGLCLGPVLPCELMFQFEQPTSAISSVFEFCTKPSFMTGADLLGSCSTPPQATPVCAAITSCQRVHFGHIVRELAQMFFVLPCPEVRQHYLIYMLQSYGHVLTTTLELLDVDWVRHFRMTFPQFLLKFYDNVEHGILTAILQHMKLTDPEELDSLVHQANDVCGTPGGSEHRTAEDAAQNLYVPITRQRVEFLERLLDPVHKPV